MEVKDHNRCCICGQIIMKKYPWNPEIKKEELSTKYHQFDPSKHLFCSNCYRKLNYTAKDESNEAAANKG